MLGSMFRGFSSAARRRGLVRGVAVAAAAVLLFGAGAVVSRLTAGPNRSPQAAPAPTSSASGDGQLDAVRDRIAGSAVGKVDKDTLDKAAVQGMLGALHDKWSNYLTPAQYAGFQRNLDGSFSGVGLWLRQGTRSLVIATVQPDSPAEAAGIRSGEPLASINGRSTASMSVCLSRCRPARGGRQRRRRSRRLGPPRPEPCA